MFSHRPSVIRVNCQHNSTTLFDCMNTATLTLSDINCIVIHDTYMLYDAIIWCPLEVLRCSRVFNAILNAADITKVLFVIKSTLFWYFLPLQNPKKYKSIFWSALYLLVLSTVLVRRRIYYART